jgi:hypothetical protein
MASHVAKHIISICLILAIVLVFTTWYYLPDYLIAKYGKPDSAGSYGDVYGSITALFTSLAFALLIYTALMQREELKLQREELRMTRDELKKSAEAQEELVRLTRVTNDFQRQIRKKDIFPEAALVNQTAHNLGEYRAFIELILQPKFYALKVTSAAMMAPSENIKMDLEDFTKDFHNRIINTNQTFSIKIIFKVNEDLNGTELMIDFEDVDLQNSYCQKIICDNGIFRALGSQPVADVLFTAIR